MPEPDVTPTPLNDTDCGLVGSLSAILTVALRLPVPLGAKVTVKLKEAFGGNVAGSSSELRVKSAALGPTTLMLLIWSEAVPLLSNVIVCGLLAVFTNSLPKPRLVGLTLIFGVGFSGPL